MQREFVKLMAKRDQEAEAILKTVASEENKNKQIAALDKKLEQDIANVAAEYAEKKRKKAEEEEKKRLEVEKGIIEQQKQAENALLDWRELMAKGNAKKLADVHRDRVDSQYRLTVEKLNAEEAAETAKATREITDKEQQGRAIEAIESRYDNERLLAEKKKADEIAKINKELQEKKNAQWTNASNAFKSLLQGDLNGFVEHADKIVQGEKSAWQKRLAENEAKYAAVGQMAQAAVQFLNQLEQKKAERAIAEARRERDEKVKLLTDQLALEKAAQDAAELEKQKVTQESNDRIQAIKDSSEKTISDLENQYRKLSTVEEKKKLEEQLQGYRENADGKSSAVKEATEAAIEANNEEARQSIEAAQKAEKAAIAAATSTKNERIDAAEATRDAEIAAIKKRQDVDQETRTKLLADAKAAFETEKKLAQDEATVKIDEAKRTASQQTDLAKSTAKTKNELAKDNQEAELKAIEAIKNGDEKAAKEILARAREDAQEKIKLAKEEADKKIEEAEKEKREKLKKVEAEKQTRIQNQKELNRQIEAENAKSAATEAAAKRKAWEAQKKADVASALIAGALATLKALASGFFPLNLVFAATTAVMTGIQVAMIRSQPAPVFEKGGFVAKGGRHGSRYSEGGIALIDRQSGREVGEMEGDEAIISREQTAANMPLINEMFRNARTPSKRNKPVTGDRPPAFKDGGVFSSPYWKKEMYLFGSKKAKREAEQAARDAEAAAQEAAAEAAAATADYGSYASGSDAGFEGSEGARADFEAAQAQGKEQLRLLEEIGKAVELSDTHTTEAIKTQTTELTRALTDLTANLEKMLGKVSTDIVKALDGSTTDNGKGLEKLSAQQKLLFAALNLNLNKGFTGLTTDTKKGFEGMSKEVVTAIEGQSEDLKLNIETLSKEVVTAIETLSDDTELNLENLSNDVVKAIGTQSDDTTEILEQLSTDLTTAIETLEKNSIETLDKFSADVTKELKTQTKETTSSLETLSDHVSDALDKLSKDTTNGLDKLATDTKTGLETLSTETSRSLDNLATQTKTGLDGMAYQVGGLKGSINAVEGAVRGVEGATRGVEGAVYGTNQAGRLDQLISSISSFGGKS